MTSAYRFILPALALFACLDSFPQSNGQKRPILEEIKRKFQQINTASDYHLVKLEDAVQIIGHATDGGATLTGYFKNDTLKKIVEWVGLSNRIVQNEYYLDKGDLVFVYSTEKQYAYNDSLQTLDYAVLVPSFQGRYYFKGSKLIDSLLSPKRLTQSATEDAATYLKRTKDYVLLLARKKN